MTTPLLNSSTRWANVHLDRETERKAALETIDLLRSIKNLAQEALVQQKENDLSWTYPFSRWQPEHLDFILATIGTGEVRISIDDGRVKLEETAIPALWHMQNDGEHSLVLALLPSVVGQAIDQTCEDLTIPNETPQNVFAAPSILLELQTALAKADLTKLTYDPAYMIELTRQPLDTNDREFLQKTLGEGQIEIWMSGFANAHIRSTKVKGIWNSHLLNNAGKELLDSVVVARIPPEVPCAAEELEDTVRIASETLQWLEDDLERGTLG